MSILIKGMEMPTNCFLCPLSVLSENRLFCELTSDEVIRAKIDRDCPLIEIPPHGRLIDADALDTGILQAGFAYTLTRRKLRYTPGEVREKIQHAPTIIEAEVDE